ncbi:hypothetical protein SUDANB60_06519 (plasmid) [Streptomyces sp. enrichment culture]
MAEAAETAGHLGPEVDRTAAAAPGPSCRPNSSSGCRSWACSATRRLLPPRRPLVQRRPKRRSSGDLRPSHSGWRRRATGRSRAARSSRSRSTAKRNRHLYDWAYGCRTRNPGETGLRRSSSTHYDTSAWNGREARTKRVRNAYLPRYRPLAWCGVQRGAGHRLAVSRVISRCGRAQGWGDRWRGAGWRGCGGDRPRRLTWGCASMAAALSWTLNAQTLPRSSSPPRPDERQQSARAVRFLTYPASQRGGRCRLPGIAPFRACHICGSRE